MIVEVLRSVLHTLRHDGWLATLALCGARLTDVGFDLRHGTDTYRWASPSTFGLDVDQVAQSEYYKPSHAASLRKVLQSLELPEPKVLLDMGCGKGRALMVAKELGFDCARGIEFSPALMAIARKNLEKFCSQQPSTTQFELILDDVRNYSLRDDENVFYLFNPFDGSVMAGVVKMIELSLAKCPRKAFVVYRAPQQRHFLDASDCFHSPFWFRCRGQAYLVFESQHG